MGIDPTKEPDDGKLRELILFIADRSSQDERFGSIKLNKLLFYSDFLAYVKLGSSITGHAYQRLENGPAPKKMLPLMNEMVDEKVLAIKERNYYGKIQKVPVALREANLEGFSAEEIAVVTEVIDTLARKNAKGISSLSHKFAGWKMAGDRELIPYTVALVAFKKPRKSDVKKALAIGEELMRLRKECALPDAE
jgi:hypothetical protein